MGNQVVKREQKKTVTTEGYESPEPNAETSDDNEVFGNVADVSKNNGTSTEKTAVTDSKGAACPKNAWINASPAECPANRPHLIRLFSRDAPGREDNTFKDRPSESDELQTIAEDSGAVSECSDCTEEQPATSPQGHRTSPMASASTSDHARHGNPRGQRDTGLLDQLGKFFGGEKQPTRKGSGKGFSAMRSTPLSSSPQRSPQQAGAHGRPGDDNPVVHFFKTIVTPRTPPPPPKGRGLSLSRLGWGTDGQKQHVHARSHEAMRSAHKGHKDARGDGQGTLSKIFKLGGKDSRSGSPSKR
ncbi:myelin basic protein isoform X1 [Polypterus senegalus]